MKLRIKSTGEVVDAEQIDVMFRDTSGDVYILKQVDVLSPLIYSSTDIDWEQRRYEIAKSAMQGLIANNNLFERFDETGECAMDLYTTAVFYADELIKQLKGGDK